ncbi:MAG: DNA alkylation repair protein [Promethearchaeota archaeon]
MAQRCVSSPSKWTRRFGVVSLWGFKRLEAPDRVFDVIGAVVSDGDRDVKRGAAWILRQLSTSNPDRVFGFLESVASGNPGKDAAWVVRNGMKKLSRERQGELSALLGGRS